MTSATWPKGTSAPARRANPHALEVAQRTALALRVTHHDANIVAAALNPLRFFAIEALANLAAEVCQGQAQRLGLGLDRQPQLTLALEEGVGDLVDPVEGGKAGLQILGGGGQLFEVQTRELDVHVFAGVEQRGRVAER